MATKTLLAGLVLATMLSPAFAQSATNTALPTWEQLTPAQRDELVAPLRERWNANPGDRERMLERARRWHAMPPEQRARAQRGMKRWEHMDPAKREQMRALFERTRNMPREQRRETFALYQAMRNMTPQQRDVLKQQWGGMTAQQREDWMREHAPRDGRGHGRDRRDGHDGH